MSRLDRGIRTSPCASASSLATFPALCPCLTSQRIAGQRLAIYRFSTFVDRRNDQTSREVQRSLPPRGALPATGRGPACPTRRIAGAFSIAGILANGDGVDGTATYGPQGLEGGAVAASRPELVEFVGPCRGCREHQRVIAVPARHAYSWRSRSMTQNPREPEEVGEVAACLLHALQEKSVTFVARDEVRASQIARALAAGAPEALILFCPASDALPGDSEPPSPANVGQRTAALRKLRSALADASYQTLRCSGAIF